MDYFNIFRTKYGACYQKNDRRWVCNCSFNSWEEADKYSLENHSNKAGQTTLLSVNGIWPDFVKTKILENKLKPIVTMERNV